MRKSRASKRDVGCSGSWFDLMDDNRLCNMNNVSSSVEICYSIFWISNNKAFLYSILLSLLIMLWSNYMTLRGHSNQNLQPQSFSRRRRVILGQITWFSMQVRSSLALAYYAVPFLGLHGLVLRSRLG